MTEKRPTSRLPQAVLVLLVGYWIALFIGTHIPSPPKVLVLSHTDKWFHFAAYTGLAFLFVSNWSLRRTVGWRQALIALALLAGFGVFDELTQIPVGRECDIFDWLADLVGITCGILLHLALAALFRRSAWLRGH